VTVPNPAIRLAHAADASDAARIARLAYAMYVDRIGFEPPPMRDDFPALVKARYLYVLEAANHVIGGYCAFWQEGENLHLSNVAVDPVFQGCGYGRALIEFAEHVARESGCAAIELYTNVHMTENQQLYPALGYDEFDRRREAGVSRVYYRKQIQ